VSPDLDPGVLADQVQATAKYAAIDPDFVRLLVEREIPRNRNAKEVVKAVRNKLHQVGGAYQENPIGYTQWSAWLETLPADLHDPQTLDFCRGMLAEHASTRERLPYLERFFSETLAAVQPIHSLLDLACGLNPLALPWLPLQAGAEIRVCDIYRDLAAFLNDYFRHFGLDGQAASCDLTRTVPSRPVQVALLLKTIPCLEQVDRVIGHRLLDELQAEHILVSFPAQSLGGKSKGMRGNYDAHFQELLAGKPFQVQRFDFPGELAYLLTRK
jgi:16S rRNA (guanine(1405)-N(7))-methyltransferase